ncbi:hypothetical protein BDW02DRAFT_573274 [Decorospora gaudefroyi]|uniref:Uncharacterized protein n=1 Tax=Decorospora gaudefroyi TaxID=184978 RepID=A0A6A5KA68_9PLEO|nr:hypothetical protein BDW02DRAFT_573274 [Decorospora gaudefroyi]
MASTTLTIEPPVTPASIPIPQLTTTSTTTTQSENVTELTNRDDVSSAASAPSLRPSVSWTSIRSTFTFSEKTSTHLGWVVALVGALFTVVALSPAFKSQGMSQRALELAEWTALKDFIEECREEVAAGVESQACLKAMKAQIPPPPYVKPGLLEKARRGLLGDRHEFNDTMRVTWTGKQVSAGELPTRGLLVLGIILTMWIFFFLRLEYLSRQLRMNEVPEDASGYSAEPPSVLEPEPAISTATVRYPPTTTDRSLRRRTVRTHPIYRHASLDGAIYAADLPEIRIRLQNGENVNEHWPYLIYRLAISPKAPDLAKRIEVARLCLDFGADVNALKGWNGQSALLIAIHFGNVPVAKLLIANGATVGYSPPDSHLTALHRCVRLATTGSSADALEIMEMLFKYGAKANQVDRVNETALHKLLMDSWYARHDDAIFQKLLPVALCLVSHGAHLIPGSLRDKFIVGNSLYDSIQAAIWERSRRIVADGRAFEKEWRSGYGQR